MSDDHYRLPRVDQRQWELLGGYLMDGFTWLVRLFGTTDEPAPVPQKIRKVTASKLSSTLRRSERARKALEVLAEEVTKPRTIRRKSSKS